MEHSAKFNIIKKGVFQRAEGGTYDTVLAEQILHSILGDFLKSIDKICYFVETLKEMLKAAG